MTFLLLPVYIHLLPEIRSTRYGTVSLMTGIDLVEGEVYGRVVDRHKSKEFKVSIYFHPEAWLMVKFD